MFYHDTNKQSTPPRLCKDEMPPQSCPALQAISFPAFQHCVVLDMWWFGKSLPSKGRSGKGSFPKAGLVTHPNLRPSAISIYCCVCQGKPVHYYMTGMATRHDSNKRMKSLFWHQHAWKCNPGMRVWWRPFVVVCCIHVLLVEHLCLGESLVICQATPFVGTPPLGTNGRTAMHALRSGGSSEGIRVALQW